MWAYVASGVISASLVGIAHTIWGPTVHKEINAVRLTDVYQQPKLTSATYMLRIPCHYPTNLRAVCDGKAVYFEGMRPLYVGDNYVQVDMPHPHPKELTLTLEESQGRGIESIFRPNWETVTCKVWHAPSNHPSAVAVRREAGKTPNVVPFTDN